MNEIVLFNPNKYIFRPRPDVKPQWGNPDHFDLLYPFSGYVTSDRGLVVNMDGYHRHIYFYKRTVLDLFSELDLNQTLSVKVQLLVSLGGGGGRYYGKNEKGEHKICIGYGVDNKLAEALDTPLELWEKLIVKDDEGLSEAELLTFNHVFFHETYHMSMRCKLEGQELNDNDPEAEKSAEDFAIRKTKEIISGKVQLAPLWFIKWCKF